MALLPWAACIFTLAGWLSGGLLEQLSGHWAPTREQLIGRRGAYRVRQRSSEPNAPGREPRGCFLLPCWSGVPTRMHRVGTQGTTAAAGRGLHLDTSSRQTALLPILGVQQSIIWWEKFPTREC
ncbi:hypothetical protein N658DRAFT_496347 [Parathielavia hyrcaniae]|uniref:Uncharacterized protein n=1 Tax=Parathielavia hyrcaniae TaxID=113614 RepID=A0AAN6Q497_9PEZI|nr:hypothetical protein N658DRAFT_496347 [Parathielavia hyrcaniae]